MRLNHRLDGAELPLVQTVILRQLDRGFKPILCFTLGALHVNVHAPLFTREKVEAETTFAKNRGAHRPAIVAGQWLTGT
jgi:hypothetical protein